MNININGQSAIAFLRGKKTYITAGAALLYFIGINHAWWPHETDIDAALGFCGIASSRAALQKLQDAFNASNTPPANTK